MEMVKKISEIVNLEDLKGLINNAYVVDFYSNGVRIQGNFSSGLAERLAKQDWKLEVNPQTGFVEGKKIFKIGEEKKDYTVEVVFT